MKVKKMFFDDYGLTGIGILCAAILGIGFLFVIANSHIKWQCSNYEEITGFESKYVNYDACYIKGSDGIFIRYDSKYKTIN